VSAAAWIKSSDLPWQQLITFGPAEFEAYARLRFLPDPVYAGQPEVTADDDAPSEHEQLRAALEVLKQHTRASDDCYFCLWEGWGSDIDGDAGARIAPAFAPSVLNGPKVVVPNRAYFLFRGSLSEFGDWGVAEMSPRRPRSCMPDPAFIWPADHAWCIANDVDPHYAGIGASATAIDELLAHPGLDVVSADPHLEQPHYW
jgi:hypothetical protein